MGSISTIGKVLIGVGAVVAVAGLSMVTLGFGPLGIVAGSIAAGIQSTFPLVSAGSMFATCTSLGMQGVFVGSAIAGASTLAAGVLTECAGEKQKEKK